MRSIEYQRIRQRAWTRSRVVKYGVISYPELLGMQALGTRMTDTRAWRRVAFRASRWTRRITQELKAESNESSG